MPSKEKLHPSLRSLSERIGASVASIEAGTKRRPNKDPLEKWYPYYAGYSLKFAEALLKAAALPSHGRVLDPWNGSGTTTLATTRLGLHGCGFDLNPVATVVAKARLANTDDAKGIRGFVQKTARTAGRSTLATTADPLEEYLPRRTVAEFRLLQSEIMTNFATSAGSVPLEITAAAFPPLASFLLLALIRAAKSQVKQRPTSNPTLFRPQTANPRQQLQTSLAAIWEAIVTEMGNELPTSKSEHPSFEIHHGDARNLDVPQQTIDFVLTSPPYCTRIDYAKLTSFELAAIGSLSDQDYEGLRRNLMGAPLVRGAGTPEPPKELPNSIHNLLHKIRTHQSKSSGSYYYKTYLQYFTDANRAIAQIRKAMKPSSAAAMVVQSSYYKDILVDLPSLYGDLARNHQMSATVAHNTSVRTVLASIHPGTRVYRTDWTYRESVVLMWKE